MLWVHRGEGTITGGHFWIPGAYVKFLPLTLTIAVIAAGVVVHGTEPIYEAEAASAGGLQPCRLGFSHFFRTPYLRRIATLAGGAGSFQELWDLQLQQDKRLLGLSQDAAAKKSERDRFADELQVLARRAGEVAADTQGLKWDHSAHMAALLWK
ncbi:hypothetical protein GPECTOR_17g999 [Gonium pectorale]|uniref:Uncharacterized protein n=1 Tax=Gonium pectorale TaxID=33097 RepID=A0A150GKQ2_GONPE|nr:hypothetical protein GPECTOR_17g999 [Gonium pectorale]|eukprot:KXZ50358.1 hypothetical protein GPECTOR_17g999 [Gonium pectorale]